MMDQGGERGHQGVPVFGVPELLAEMKQALRPGQEGKTGVELLRKLLANPSRDIRTDALHFLGGLGRAAVPAIPDLATTLQDPGGKGNVAQEAARTLGRIGPPAHSAIPALVKLMETPDAAVPGQQAAIALAKIDPGGDTVLPELIRALEREGSVGVGAAIALESMGSRAAPAVPALIRILMGSDSRTLRTYVAKALGAIGPEACDAIPALEEATRRRERAGRPDGMDDQGEARRALQKIRGGTEK